MIIITIFRFNVLDGTVIVITTFRFNMPDVAVNSITPATFNFPEKFSGTSLDWVSKSPPR